MLSTLTAALAFAMPSTISMTVPYTDGTTEFEGFMAAPRDANAKTPAVLIVHQWMGLTEYEKMRAEMLAEQGYIAFAADIYGKGVRPTGPQQAGAQAGKYKGNRALYRQRLDLAYKTMLKQPGVDASRTAAIGYCFGGTGVIELARAGIPALGVASFHGGLDSPTPADGANIKGKVLVLAGADDPFQKASDLDAFNAEMKAHNVDLKYIAYPGAVHAFTEKEAGNDNSKGAAYNEDADKKSWMELKGFLAHLFSSH